MQRYYKGGSGTCVPDQVNDLRHGVTQGYLQGVGGDQVVKGGVLHRGSVGSSKRARGKRLEGSRNGGRSQAVLLLPQGQGRVERPTHVRIRGGESPARMEKQGRARGSPVRLTKALRPAPGISKKTRPKKQG